MGSLGLAGAISGAGEGASKALTMAQAQYGAERLQAARDEGDSNRQARLLEAQKAMHTETIETQKSEGTATRGTQEKIASEQNTTTKEVHKDTNQTSKDIATSQNLSHESVAKTAAESHAEVARINAASHEKVARLQRDLQTAQFDKTFTAAKMTSATKAMDELGNLMIHLNQAVSNPLADKTSADYKSASEMLAKSHRLFMVYQQHLAEMMASGPGGVPAAPGFPAKTEAAQATPELPAFVPPPISKPGLAQTPAPIQGRPY